MNKGDCDLELFDSNEQQGQYRQRGLFGQHGQRGKKTAKIILLVIMFISSALLITYSTLLSLPKSVTASLKADTKKVIVIGKSKEAISFWISLLDGIEAAASEFDVEYKYWAPDTESDIDDQITLVYRAIGENPDAIILASSDYARLAQPARAVRNAGIILIKLDSDVDETRQTVSSCFVATDNVAAGIKAGEAMKALLPEGKKVAVISHQIGTATSTDRDNGVRQGLGTEITVLVTADADGSEEKAYEMAAEILKDPEVGGIVCLNEYSTTGGARAILGAGKTDEVILVGFDNSRTLNIYLEEGVLLATVIQRPFNMGYIAIKNAAILIDGGTVDAVYDTGSILVTKDTMYLEENEKLLFPFT